jgi:hypothetical protein
MFSSLKQHFARWRANPRRFELSYVDLMILGVANAHLSRKEKVLEEFKLEPLAVKDFVAATPSSVVIPMFPRQSALLPTHLC